MDRFEYLMQINYQKHLQIFISLDTLNLPLRPLFRTTQKQFNGMQFIQKAPALPMGRHSLEILFLKFVLQNWMLVSFFDYEYDDCFIT